MKDRRACSSPSLPCLAGASRAQLRGKMVRGKTFWLPTQECPICAVQSHYRLRQKSCYIIRSTFKCECRMRWTRITVSFWPKGPRGSWKASVTLMKAGKTDETTDSAIASRKCSMKVKLLWQAYYKHQEQTKEKYSDTEDIKDKEMNTGLDISTG